MPNLFLIPILLRKSYKDITVFSVIAVFAIILLSIFSQYLFYHRASGINFDEIELCNPAGSINCFILLLFGYLN